MKNLKKSMDEGKLSKDAYEKLLGEDTKRFRNREKEIIEDMAFYNDEISNAPEQLKGKTEEDAVVAYLQNLGLALRNVR